MSQRYGISALLTANVFQNGLSRYEESHRYYTDLLRRLPSQPVNWYMSALDCDLAFALWDIYHLGGDTACQEAYAKMREIIRICPVDEWIVEDSGFPGINFFDAIRLACAIDRNVDALVTWEPHQFATNSRDRIAAQQNGYFLLNLRSKMAEDDSVAHPTIGIFSVSAFLLHLGELEASQSSQETPLGRFQLERLKIEMNDDDISGIIVIRTPLGDLLQEMAFGSTPCEAIYKAIDQCVDRYILLPKRNLVHFSVPEINGGADAEVEAMITIECDRRIFRASASSTNVIRALGDAYVNAINQICASLSFG